MRRLWRGGALVMTMVMMMAWQAWASWWALMTAESGGGVAGIETTAVCLQVVDWG